MVFPAHVGLVGAGRGATTFLGTHADAGLTFDEPSFSTVADWTWEPWEAVVASLGRGREMSVWCREQVAQLESLGAPSTWPAASPDLLPPALRPPAVTAPVDNVGQLLDHWG